MSSSDLHFDVKKVDVKKAEEYLMINKEFHSIGCEDSGVIEHDACNNKIFLSSVETLQYRSSNLSKSELSAKFMDLAELVLENMNLLCQLDYLVRKTPIEETRDVEIKLLVQNLIYHSSLEERDESDDTDIEICMYDDIPLSRLGLIAALSQLPLTITSTKHTAVICSLFVELCHKVGLEDYVYLVFVSNADINKYPSFFTEELRSGCVGIVTEKADIDSAIDTFLYATRRFPWHIETIYVQECVLDQFKKRIEWKTKEPASDVDKMIIKYCSSVRVYEDKMYLFEFVGNIKKISKNSIIIEAYRTNKELISIMSEIKTLGVSLWSSDVAESNEIALNIKANFVWINDFGRFDGPPVASQAYYSSVFNYADEPDTLVQEIEEILKIRNSWNKLDVIDRNLKVWKATRTTRADIEGSKLDIVFKCSNNSTTNIGNKICTVFRIPIILYVKTKSLQDLLKHMNFILQGSAVIVLVEESSESDAIMKYCNALQSCGAPVGFTSMDDGFRNQIRYDTKVIWSSIGTIFAN
ncbi:uncharacterized protein LOC123661785 [Melitaea cinxia]|uniref:uncharacterized protein LOC123661785 n=1 Tax=Melitaea cinxia TaxID=113334 RepID=UPI001E274A9F|nr:uncharacterized protein LOC123661785 [Melitaea cinxia]